MLMTKDIVINILHFCQFALLMHSDHCPSRRELFFNYPFSFSAQLCDGQMPLSNYFFPCPFSEMGSLASSSDRFCIVLCQLVNQMIAAVWFGSSVCSISLQKEELPCFSFNSLDQFSACSSLILTLQHKNSLYTYVIDT